MNLIPREKIERERSDWQRIRDYQYAPLRVRSQAALMCEMLDELLALRDAVVECPQGKAA